MLLQRLSEYFGIPKSVFKRKGIFDAIIGVDSGFYLDPTLLKNTRIPEFKGAYAKVEEHYKKVFSLLKFASANHSLKAWNQAIRLCALQEPRGIFLGYGKTSGRGVGKKLAEQLLISAEKIWKMGIDDPQVIALLGILEEGFGADRISDMTLNIIQENLLAYTHRMVETIPLKHSIPLKYKNGKIYKLPINPLNRREPLLLIPTNLLRALPASNEHIWDSFDENQELRQRVNEILGSSLQKAPKNYVKTTVLSSKDKVLDFLEAFKNLVLSGYDFESDPEVKQRWLELGEALVKQYPLELKVPKVATSEDIKEVIRKIIWQFKLVIENHGWAKYLYKPDESVHNEEFIQKLFLAVAISHCKANDLDISPETDQGSGAIDFKISRGFKQKFLVELKWDKNKKLIEGYTRQLPRYAQCEETANCFFVVVEVSQNGKNLKNLQKVYYAQKEQGIKQPELFIIDGKIKPSASKLKRESPKKSIPFFGEEFTY